MTPVSDRAPHGTGFLYTLLAYFYAAGEVSSRPDRMAYQADIEAATAPLTDVERALMAHVWMGPTS